MDQIMTQQHPNTAPSPLTTSELSEAGRLVLTALRQWVYVAKRGGATEKPLFDLFAQHDLAPAGVLLDMALKALARDCPHTLHIHCPLHHSLTQDEATLLIIISFLGEPLTPQVTALFRSLIPHDHNSKCLRYFNSLSEYLHQQQRDVYFTSGTAA